MRGLFNMKFMNFRDIRGNANFFTSEVSIYKIS